MSEQQVTITDAVSAVDSVSVLTPVDRSAYTITAIAQSGQDVIYAVVRTADAVGLGSYIDADIDTAIAADIQSRTRSGYNVVTNYVVTRISDSKEIGTFSTEEEVRAAISSDRTADAE